FFSSRRRHTSFSRDWSSDVCSSDLASVVFRSSYTWGDDEWMARRAASRPWDERMAVYEVHLGSWMRHPDGRLPTYEELADKLAEERKGRVEGKRVESRGRVLM